MKPIQLKTHSVLIDAPRELVFQKMTAFNRGRLPGESSDSSRVVSGEGDELVVEFKTKVGPITYTTIEEVKLYPPERIAFEHITGPLHCAYEEFTFEDRDGQTLLTHKGSIIWSQLPLIGWLGAVLYTRPMFNRFIARHLQHIKTTCEARAARSHVFRRRKDRSSAGG